MLIDFIAILTTKTEKGSFLFWTKSCGIICYSICLSKNDQLSSKTKLSRFIVVIIGTSSNQQLNIQFKFLYCLIGITPKLLPDFNSYFQKKNKYFSSVIKSDTLLLMKINMRRRKLIWKIIAVLINFDFLCQNKIRR